MQTTRYEIEYLLTTILIVGGMLLWLLSSGGVATADIYADSAHGNSLEGVNRSGTVYPIGSCAHCHDTFDPNICENDLYGLMLFAPNDNPTPTPQSDNFCFQCHDSDSSVQAVTNYSYSRTFGGGSSTTPDDIKDAFNLTGGYASSHNLSDVLNHAVGRDIGFTSNTNPCLVCHDHHASQQNYPVTLSGLGGVKTAIRRPGDYGNAPTNLWGDEDYATSGFNEMMTDYTAKYQAPYFLGGSGYEPANDATYNGSNLPSFKNFCTIGCHYRQDVYSTERSRNLTKIRWANEYLGDQHGKAHAPGLDPFERGYTVAPYGNDSYNYVLSCTDCHETHGSENEWLLRTSVNGKDNITMEWAGDWWEFCTACHGLTASTTTYHADKWEAYSPKCPVCHEHGNDPDMNDFF